MEQIIKVISVVDTREYEEIGDRWKPIPGSGISHTCSRCGRTHEVHATVELNNGAKVIVGTGCMKSENAEITSKVKSLTSASKRLAKLQAEAAKLQALDTEYERVKAEVETLPVPEIREEEEEFEEHGRKYVGIHMFIGDTKTYGYPEVSKGHRTAQAIKSWKENRQAERGIQYKHRSAASYLRSVQRSIKKLEDKIEELTVK